MQTSNDKDFSVFFGDMNSHVPAQYSQPKDLRARILLHLVLSEPLVIGDSHSLNSPMFRSLVVQHDEPPYRNSDLAEFLRRGDLRVARRSVMDSFITIRDDHFSRGIDDVPAVGYAAWLDEVTVGNVAEYDAPTVSTYFKQNFLSRLDRRLERLPVATPPLYVRTLEMMRNWCDAEDVLFYKKIRETYDAWRSQEKNSSKETEEGVIFIERAASSSYHLAVPQAIESAVAGPRNDELITLPASVRPVEDLNLPYGFVNPTVWQNIPVDGVIEILELPSRQQMLAELATARADGTGRREPLMESMAAFADALDTVLHRTFIRGRHDEVLASMRYAEVKAMLTALNDESTGANGIRMHAVWNDPTGRQKDDFDIVSMPVAVTESEPWLEPDIDVPAPNNRVVAGTGTTTDGPLPPTAG